SVSAAGTVRSGTAGVTALRVNTGSYLVEFPVGIDACGYAAAATDRLGFPYVVTATPPSFPGFGDDPNAILVSTYLAQTAKSGSRVAIPLVDAAFNLLVVCAP
ncbi:hypothetical protein, partial [Oharaeibacter diazotrophicus]